MREALRRLSKTSFSAEVDGADSLIEFELLDMPVLCKLMDGFYELGGG